MSRATNLAGFVSAIYPSDNISVGFATIRDLNVTGVATFATINVQGVSYADVSGISTTSRGLTGTPDIEVRNIVATGATFTGDVTVQGTITNEDVTNVDVIGIITGRAGLDITGESTFDGNVNVTGVVTATTFDGNLTGNVTGNVVGDVTGDVTGNVTGTATTAQGLTGTPDISVTDISGRHGNFSGVVTANAFAGDGANITGISTLNIVNYGTGISGGGGSVGIASVQKPSNQVDYVGFAVTDLRFVGAAVTGTSDVSSGFSTATVTITKTLVIGKRDSGTAQLNISSGDASSLQLRDGTEVTLPLTLG